MNINLNILECKYLKELAESVDEVNNNLNILECKLV